MPKRSFPIQDEDNPEQQFYDREFNGLGSHNNSDDDGHGAASPGDLQSAENKPGAGARNGIGKGETPGGGLYNPNDSALDKTPAGRAKKMAEGVASKLKTNRGKTSGAVGTILLAIILFIGGEAPRQLNNFANDIMKEEAKVEQHMDQKLNQRLWNQIVNTAKNKNGTEDEQKEVADEEAKAKADGDVVNQEIDDYSLTSDQVVADMVKGGWKIITDPNGHFVKLENEEGDDITSKFGLDDLQGATIDDVMKTWEVNLMEQYRPEMTIDVGADFNTFPESVGTDKESTDPLKEINDSVEDGASGEQIATAETQLKEEQPGADASEQDKQDFAQDESNSKLLRDIQQASQDEYDKTQDAAQAQQAGEAAAEADLNDGGAALGRGLFWANIASTLCTVDQNVTEAADSRIPQIIILLARGWNTWASIAARMNSGKPPTSQEVSTAMKLLEGSGLLKKTNNADGSTAVSSQTYTASAEWARVSGESSQNLSDLTPGASPTHSAAQGLIDNINKHIGVGKYACKALNSDVGFAVQAGANTIQFVSNFGDFGATQAAVLAANIGFTVFLETVLIPSLVSYVGNTAAAASTYPVAIANNAGAGAHLSFNEYARQSGGLPQSSQSMQNINQVLNVDQQDALAHESWAYRTFAVDNPQSLTSHLIDSIPIGTASILSGFTNYFTSFPQTLGHDIASIFTLHNAFADASSPATINMQQCGDPRCLTTYDIPDNIISAYTAQQAGDFLFGTSVTYNGKSVRRIDALGNMTTYSYTPQGDPNNNDLLHCFVDPESMLADNSLGDNDAAKANCGTMGTYDMAQDGAHPPSGNDIAGVYCYALMGNSDDASCLAAVTPQLHDDLNQYSVYYGYFHEMKGNVSITNNQ